LRKAAGAGLIGGIIARAWIMLIVYHPAFFAADLATACADLDGVRFARADSPEALLAAAPGADAVVMNAGLYTQALAAGIAGTGVRWLQFTSAGTEPASAFGVPEEAVVTNASAAWAVGVAEHAVALLLASLRRLPELFDAQAGGRWAHGEIVPRLQYLDGARVGVLGFGAIGQAIAERLRPFGATVVAMVRSPRDCPGADEVRSIADGAVSDLDCLVSSLPLNRGTRHLVDGAMLARLRDGCVFVNVGRGPTVDEPALLAELASGRLRAALDVFETEPLPADHPAWRTGGLIVSPHLAALGGTTGPARLLRICRDNIVRFRDGQALLHRVSLAAA
jgi:phosphoglycerate dehydrogenase-like enzyme